MGGGEQGGSNTAATMQQLLDLQKKQQLFASFGKGLQQVGAAVGQQQPYMQMQQSRPGAAPQPQAGQTGEAPAAGGALGALFPQGGAGGGGGISQMQLAEILRQLGYAGQGG